MKFQGKVAVVSGGTRGIGFNVTKKLEIGRAHVWTSSHTVISYAVFCLKKKKKKTEYISHKYIKYVDQTHNNITDIKTIEILLYT